MKQIFLILLVTLSCFAEETFPKTPDFTLRTTTGGNYTLSENLSGLKVINFWATWCGPCLSEMTQLKALYEKYEEKGVEFIAISVDDSQSSGKVPAYVRSRRLPFTILLDPEKSYYNMMQIANIPALIVVNEKQEVVYRHSGFTAGDEVELERILLEHLPTEI